MTRRPEWSASAATVWAPTAAEMATLDRRAIERGLTVERTLIEAAGRELAHRVAAGWPGAAVCGLVGSGHNGADVLVALRTLAAWGRDVRAVHGGGALPEPDVLAGWPIDVESAEEFLDAPPARGVVIDGLLGTGAAGAPRAPMDALIEGTNQLDLAVVAADLPSGVDATTGDVPGTSVRADLTVCFGWPKLGLFREPARSRCGRIEAVEIGFPPLAEADAPVARVITARWAATMLRPRPADGHKGTSGYLLLAAGAAGMAGAAILAGRAAYRAGAGIVRLLGAPENREIVQRSMPGAIFVSWEADPGPSIEWADALALGPGLGGGPERDSFVRRLLDERGERPAVLDADALNAFAGAPEDLASRLRPDDVLTPHPGEMARLMPECDPIGSPVDTARAAAARFGCTVVSKGAPTVVALPDGRVRLATTGGPAFAVGGTGDVLTGAIGALLAAGAGGPDAAAVALQLTGMAAELSGFGGVGMVAEDLPRSIPDARRALETLGPAPAGAVRFVLPSVAT